MPFLWNVNNTFYYLLKFFYIHFFEYISSLVIKVGSIHVTTELPLQTRFTE